MIEKWKQLRERDQKEPAGAAVPLHPLLFALWPVLFVYAENQQYLRFSQTRSALLVMTGSTLVLLYLLAVILRSMMKGGAVLSLLWVLFFSFGHVFSLLWPDSAAYAPTTESLALLTGWAIGFAAGTAIVLRVKSHWREITGALNMVALALVLIQLFRVGVYETSRLISQPGLGNANPLDTVESLPPESLPNIYYLILDAYARGDILEEVYNYDNSEFLRFLDGHGFYIAERSRANYAQTDLSLASSLSLDYLDELISAIGVDTGDRRPVERMIQENSVFRFLRNQGYTIVSVSSGYSTTELRSADIYVEAGRVWNELEVELFLSTPIPWLAVRRGQSDPHSQHRQRVLFALGHVLDTIHRPGPQFVFAHILAPHDPFVFDENGGEVDFRAQFNLQDGVQYDEQGQILKEFVLGYSGQLSFVNSKLRVIVGELIAQSSRPVIVILQADHGPGYPLDVEDPGSDVLRQKLSIFNAYLFPDRDYGNLYQEITPVNTFRVIFSQYLGTDLEMLEDRSYYSTWERPYQFVDVTDEVRSAWE